MRVFVVSLAALTLLTSSCRRDEVKTMSIERDELKEISPAQWDVLAQKKIYFGHQSVGNNLLQALRELMAEQPGVTLTIEDTRYPGDFGKPLLAQSGIGHNYDPVSKCDEFAKIIDNGIGEKSDLAFFKFCYVDIGPDTDVDALFRHYVNTIQTIEVKYPRLKTAHVTVPLTTVPTGIRVRLKHRLRRPVEEELANINRHRFNSLLRARYGDTGRLFDLADYESSWGDGRRCSFTAADGKTYPALAPVYTDDGGHLNAAGRRSIGKRFLLFLQENA